MSYLMSIGIMDLIRNCDPRRVAFAVGTLLSAAVVLPQSALAADEADIQRLIETRECQGCDLHEADFRRMDLADVKLQGADLEGANFYYANLDGAELQGANLIDVNFTYASVRNAYLDGADLRYAIFDWTDLSGTSITGADLRDSYFDHTDLTQTILDDSDLTDTLVFDVDFSQASLCGVIDWTGLEYRRGCTVAVPDEIDDTLDY
ncbi:MAG: pentapeptide repeat-containing protein [Cyanobacteria bacterium P01_D01_bin.36]